MTVLGKLPALPRYLNPKLMPVARRLPPLAVIHHKGRRSGREYDTSVQAYRTGSKFLVGLAYDSNAQWALNLLAAGTGEMTRSRQRYRLTSPHRRGPEARQDLPALVGPMMRALAIDAFLEFEATPEKA